jgi:hypothetical protein
VITFPKQGALPRSQGFTTPVVLGAFALFAAACGTLVALESRGRAPMLPPGWFRSPTFSAATAVALLINLGFYGELFVSTLYFQLIRGYSALLTGLALLPQMGMATIASFLSGRVMARTGPRRPMIAWHWAAPGCSACWWQTPARPTGCCSSRRLEDLAGVPFEELAAGAVRSAFGESDRLTGSGIELLAVTEIRSEPRTDHEPVLRVHAQVSMVEHGVHVRPQQPVVETVLAALCDGPNDRSDNSAFNGPKICQRADRKSIRS